MQRIPIKLHFIARRVVILLCCCRKSLLFSKINKNMQSSTKNNGINTIKHRKFGLLLDNRKIRLNNATRNKREKRVKPFLSCNAILNSVSIILFSSAAGTAWLFLGFCRSDGLQRLLHGGRVLLPAGPHHIQQPDSLRFPGRGL